MITNKMKELLKKIADLAYQASDEVYDDNNENGTAGILNLCDQLYEKIDEFLESEMKPIINANECKPLSGNIEGKLVVIDPDFFKPEFREAKYQIVLALSGFGCDASKNGNAVYVEEIHTDNPEHYRQERYKLIGEPTEEMIENWKSMYGEFNEETQRILNRQVD